MVHIYTGAWTLFPPGLTQSGKVVARAAWAVFFFVLVVSLQPSHAQDASDEKERKTIPMPLDLPVLAEIDSLDDKGSPIRRFFVTSQGMRGQTVPIPGTEGWFCTLSLVTQVSLNYWPTLDQWVFQIRFSEEAELTAGGLATCHRLPT